MRPSVLRPGCPFLEDVRLLSGFIYGRRASRRCNTGDIRGATRDIEEELKVKLPSNDRKSAEDFLATLKELEKQLPQSQSTDRDGIIANQKRTRGAGLRRTGVRQHASVKTPHIEMYTWREDAQKYRCECCLRDGKYHYCKTQSGITQHIRTNHETHIS